MCSVTVGTLWLGWEMCVVVWVEIHSKNKWKMIGNSIANFKLKKKVLQCTLQVGKGMCHSRWVCSSECFLICIFSFILINKNLRLFQCESYIEYNLCPQNQKSPNNPVLWLVVEVVTLGDHLQVLFEQRWWFWCCAQFRLSFLFVLFESCL